MKGKRNERRRLEPPVNFCDLIYADDLAIMLACHYVGCLVEEARVESLGDDLEHGNSAWRGHGEVFPAESKCTRSSRYETSEERWRVSCRTKECYGGGGGELFSLSLRGGELKKILGVVFDAKFSFDQLYETVPRRAKIG